MTTSEFVSNVYLVAAGKLPTFSTGSKKWNKIVAIGNNKIDTWQSEPGVDWHSLYSPEHPIGIVDGENSFELGESVRKLSDAYGDTVKVVHLDGVVSDYSLVEPDRLGYYSTADSVCARIGSKIVFKRDFTLTDPQYGGEIRVPMYGYARHLVNDGDLVPVDNPQWLVLVTAAEYVRNDISKQNQYGNLINEANSLMEKMRESNSGQGGSAIRPYEVLGATW